MELGLLILRSLTLDGCAVFLMLLIYEKVHHSSSAATRSFAREEPIQTGHLIIFLDSCIIKKEPGKINKEWRNTSNTYMQSGADIKGRRRKGSTTPH